MDERYFGFIILTCFFIMLILYVFFIIPIDRVRRRDMRERMDAFEIRLAEMKERHRQFKDDHHNHHDMEMLDVEFHHHKRRNGNKKKRT